MADEQTDPQLVKLQEWIAQKQQAGYTQQQIHDYLSADPTSPYGQVYNRMPPLVPRTWPQTIGREAQLGAEQFVRGVPSIGALPGNLWNVGNQLMGGAIGPSPTWLPTGTDVDRWVTSGERAMGVEPIVPQTPGERLYAGAMQGIGASAIPIGGGLGLAARGITGAGSGLAAEATREYLPQFGPLAPVAAGLVTGGALSASTRAAQGANWLPGGPRDYGDVFRDYGAVETGVIPPGLSRTDVSRDLRDQLAHDTTSPTGTPGARGVPNTNLSQQQVDNFVKSKGDTALRAVQRDPEIATDFANSPTRQPILERGGAAILSMNPQRHIPQMDRNDTLGIVFPGDESILRSRFAPGPTEAASEHAHLMRWIMAPALAEAGRWGAETVGGLVGHTDPSLAAAAAVVGAALPWARWGYTNAPPGTLSGLTVGGATGAQLTNPPNQWYSGGAPIYPGAPPPPRRSTLEMAPPSP